MTKKELVCTLLKKLEPHRDLAGGLLLLVEQETVTNELIEHLLVTMHQAMKEVQHAGSREQFKKATTVLKKLQKQETKETYTEDQLEQLLDTV